MTGWIWMLMGLVGLIALGAALYYGQYKSTHPPHSPPEDRRRDEAARHLYEEVEKDRVRPSG